MGGSFKYCCIPCLCDLTDFVKVDSATVSGTSYNVLVIGNPCARDPAVNLTSDGRIDEPSGMGNQTLADVAPEVKCSGNVLVNATMSNGGHPIIGLLHSSTSDSDVSGANCASRAAAGYNSGMGQIFRKV